jgi:glutathione synthase/RimK-type ligase-like ATP-grasp enzyme
MNLKHLGLVTCRTMSTWESHLESEDELLVNWLKQKDVHCTLAYWDDPNVNWQQFDLVMLKSPWDYFNRPFEFSAWLDKLDNERVRVMNPLNIVRWNMDKIYLRELENARIPVIPTVWLDKGSVCDIHYLFSYFKSEKIVVKPRISGGSYNTFIITRSEEDIFTEKINQLLLTENFMAQPFLEEIKNGEASFIFFGGKFSHAVKKIPKEGDFRVQHYFGGRIESYTASTGIFEQAKNVNDHFATKCLYARVDGIEINGKLHIIELELIEPFLFLFSHGNSFSNLYNAMLQVTV